MKQQTEFQAKLLVQLQALAAEKVRAINKFLEFKVLVQIEELKGMVSGSELAQILQPNIQMDTANESSSGQKKIQYKPNEDFLTARKKACPLYRLLDTSIPPEDISAILDYLTSGGSFLDVATPIKFLKKMIYPEMFRSFNGAISKAISVDKKPHTVPTIVDTLRSKS